MKLSILATDQPLNILVDSVKADPSEITGIAELLRQEVSARSHCLRSVAISRVSRFVAPAVALDSELILDVCEDLENVGDFLLGDGGILFQSPVRAINLGGGTYRFITSLPTNRLASLIKGTWRINGISRTCQLEPNQEQPLQDVIDSLGGVILSPSSWAGLNKVLPSNKQWLDGLERRFQTEAKAQGSLEKDEQLSWAGCVVTSDGVTWKFDESSKNAQLWRARNRWGYWYYAWTKKGSPTISQFIQLRPDEGLRSYFALARVLGSPIEAQFKEQGEVAELILSTWLPIAEYRYLTISALAVRYERKAKCWFINKSQVVEVLRVLEERLGLVIKKEEAK